MRNRFDRQLLELNNELIQMGSLIEQAIEKCIKGMNPNALIILQSIPGIGPVWASGILSEIGDISAFHSSDALAKYAGLYWPKGDSGDFISEDNQMSKAGNPYLRHYFGEAANSIRKHIPEYADFYARKYAEVSKHQHKRAKYSKFPDPDESGRYGGGKT